MRNIRIYWDLHRGNEKFFSTINIETGAKASTVCQLVGCYPEPFRWSFTRMNQSNDVLFRCFLDNDMMMRLLQSIREGCCRLLFHHLADCNLKNLSTINRRPWSFRPLSLCLSLVPLDAMRLRLSLPTLIQDQSKLHFKWASPCMDRQDLGTSTRIKLQALQRSISERDN